MTHTDTVIRAITFDAAGTLLAPAPSVGHVYAGVAAAFGIQADAEHLDHAFRRAFSAATKNPTSPAPFDKPDAEQYAWWREIVQETFRSAGHDGRFGAAFDAFYNELYDRFAQPGAWHIFPDVLPVLDQLYPANIPMAIVSNWDNRLQRLVAATPIARYMRFVLTSADARCMKPHAGIFQQAAHRLGVEPHQLLHIGDSPREDIDGARGAGSHALQIDRGSSSDADPVIKTLAEIPARLSLFR